MSDSEGKNHTKLSIKGLRQVTSNFNSNSPLLCKEMALKMTLINKTICVKIHSLIFEDAMKSKWHLTVRLYRCVSRAHPSEPQGKKVISQALRSSACSLKRKPSERIARCPDPRCPCVLCSIKLLYVPPLVNQM